MSMPIASPPQPAGPRSAVDRVRRARLAGQLSVAVSEAMTALAGGAVTLELAAEAARAHIVAGRPEVAAQLCQLLAAARPGSGPALETVAMARLALQQGQPGQLAGLPAPEGSGWLARWQRDGEDLCPPLAIRDLRVAIVNGPTLYTVTGACTWCGHERGFDLRTTLLVSVEGLCPACYGRYGVTWDTLRAFIRQRFPALVAEGARDEDHDLIEHVRRRLLEDPAVPEIAHALGQEYHFLLNELLVRRRMAAAGTAVAVVGPDGGQP